MISDTHPPESRPWISCCIAVSADGKISSSERRPCGWTSARDHQRLHDLRVGPQAIIAGRTTVITDRMTMTAPGSATPPLRCIVSRSHALPAEHPIFQRSGGPIHCLFTEQIPVDAPSSAKHHHQSLKDFIRKLHFECGVNHLHCEGGGELIRSLAELDWLDVLYLTLAAHTIFGGKNSPTLTGVPGDFLPASRLFTLAHFEPDLANDECHTTWIKTSAMELLNSSEAIIPENT